MNIRMLLLCCCMISLLHLTAQENCNTQLQQPPSVETRVPWCSRLNNNPTAVIIVEYDAATRSRQSAPWLVFGTMAVNGPFLTRTGHPCRPESNFMLPGKCRWNSLLRRAGGTNSSKGKLLINHPQLNNQPSAAFYASQVWNRMQPVVFITMPK